MAYRRPPDGHRIITLQLPAELIAHLDRRATDATISRAAMVRQLILADRQATAAA